MFKKLIILVALSQLDLGSSYYLECIDKNPDLSTNQWTVFPQNNFGYASSSQVLDICQGKLDGEGIYYLTNLADGSNHAFAKDGSKLHQSIDPNDLTWIYIEYYGFIANSNKAFMYVSPGKSQYLLPLDRSYNCEWTQSFHQLDMEIGQFDYVEIGVADFEASHQFYLYRMAIASGQNVTIEGIKSQCWPEQEPEVTTQATTTMSTEPPVVWTQFKVAAMNIPAGANTKGEKISPPNSYGRVYFRQDGNEEFVKYFELGNYFESFNPSWKNIVPMPSYNVFELAEIQVVVWIADGSGWLKIGSANFSMGELAGTDPCMKKLTPDSTDYNSYVILTPVNLFM